MWSSPPEECPLRAIATIAMKEKARVRNRPSSWRTAKTRVVVTAPTITTVACSWPVPMPWM